MVQSSFEAVCLFGIMLVLNESGMYFFEKMGSVYVIVEYFDR